MRWSELPVDAGGEDGDRAAVAVEGGVVDVLVIDGEVNVLPEGQIVIGFDDFFPAVVEGAVAVEDSQAAGFEVSLVFRGNAGDYASEAEGVIGAMPAGAVDA